MHVAFHRSPCSLPTANASSPTIINYEMTVRGINEFVEITTIIGQAYCLPTMARSINCA